MQDRFNFRIPQFNEDGTFRRFFYMDLGSYIPAVLGGGYSGEPQQCTGLKDKNGKLIYEGDILRINNREIQPVEYMKCYAQFHIEGHGVVESFFTNIYEIIGNIYENPELLEV